MTSTCISDAPLELLYWVMGFLGEDDFQRLKLLSRFWYQLVRRHTTRVYIGPNATAAQVAKTLRARPNMHRLYWSRSDAHPRKYAAQYRAFDCVQPKICPGDGTLDLRLSNRRYDFSSGQCADDYFNVKPSVEITRIKLNTLYMLNNIHRFRLQRHFVQVIKIYAYLSDEWDRVPLGTVEWWLRNEIRIPAQIKLYHRGILYRYA